MLFQSLFSNIFHTVLDGTLQFIGAIQLYVLFSSISSSSSTEAEKNKKKIKKTLTFFTVSTLSAN